MRRNPSCRLVRSIATIAILAATGGWKSDAKIVNSDSNSVGVINVAVKKTDKQTIKGWGVFPSYHHGSVWADNFDILRRSGVQKALYQDLGINYIRVEIIAGYYDGSKTDKLARGKTGVILMKDLLDHIKKARVLNPKIKYIVSVWSPPASLKAPTYEEGHVWLNNATKMKMGWYDGIESVATRYDTHLIGYGTGSGTSTPSAQEIEYCNWITAALKYLNSNGAGLPAALSVQNELTFAPGYDGCVYDSAQWRRVVKKLRAVLNAAGFSSAMIHGPEGNNYRDNTNILWDKYSGFYADPELNAAVGGIATHSYDDSWAANADINDMFQKFDEGIGAYPNKEVWMTEFCNEGNMAPPGSTEIDWTINSMRHFAREMVRFRTQYWFWWMGWSYAAKPDGKQLLYGQIADNSSVPPLKTKTYQVLSKLWKSAPPGCKVREMSSDRKTVFLPQPQPEDVNCDLVAFRDASSTVVLLVNHTANSQKMKIGGLSGTAAQVFQTTATQDMAAKPSQAITSETIGLTVPARSVNVVVTNG